MMMMMMMISILGYVTVLFNRSRISDKVKGAITITLGITMF